MPRAYGTVTRVNNFALAGNKATQKLNILIIDVMHILRAEEALDFFHKQFLYSIRKMLKVQVLGLDTTLFGKEVGGRLARVQVNTR